MTIIATINATEAKNRFGDMIRRAYQGKEHLIVERAGIPVVAIVPISDYQQLLVAGDQATSQQIVRGAAEAQAREQLLAFLADMHPQMPVLPQAVVEADIAEAVAVVRAVGAVNGSAN